MRLATTFVVAALALAAFGGAQAQTEYGAIGKMKDGKRWYTDGTTMYLEIVKNYTFEYANAASSGGSSAQAIYDEKFEYDVYADTAVQYTARVIKTKDSEELYVNPDDQLIAVFDKDQSITPKKPDNGRLSLTYYWPQGNQEAKVERSVVFTISYLPLSKKAADKLHKESSLSGNKYEPDFMDGEFVGFSMLWSYVAIASAIVAYYILRFIYNMVMGSRQNSGAGLSNNIL